MKKYSTITSVIIGYILSSVLAFFLPDINLSEILAVIILILGGFIATYISITNKARIGLYEGIVYSIGSLIVFFLSGHKLTFYSVVIFVSIPLLGLIGGFIAKQLRLRLDNRNELDENANY